MHVKNSSKDPVDVVVVVVASESKRLKANQQMSESEITSKSVEVVDSPSVCGSSCSWNWKNENVKVSNHPVLISKINRMRRKDTDSKLYRELMYEVGTFLAYESTSDLSLTNCKKLQGVSGDFDNQELKERIAIAPVLRSGLGLVDSMLTFTPTATIVHLGLFREKTTLQPIEYYSRLPSDNSFDICYILDPVIATGGTTAAAIDMIKDWGVNNIRIICVNASKSGLEYIHKIHPDVKIYVGLVDQIEKLGENEEIFIVPAVGDAGDRLFNSVI